MTLHKKVINNSIQLFGLGVMLILLTACPSGDGSNTPPAKDGVVYGGKFKISEIEQIQSLYPPAIIDLPSVNVASQIYEGLVKLSTKDLSVIPAIAERWEIDPQGRVYKFYLKKGVYFHDNACFPAGKGREVTANDVKYSLEQLCKADPKNLMFGLTMKDKLLGANEYYEATANGNNNTSIQGIKVIDTYTIQLSLAIPNASFLNILALPAASIIPVEAIESYGYDITVGTGPFLLTQKLSAQDDQITLVKNPKYHGKDSSGNQLPFLDTVEIKFLSSKKAQIEAFKNEELDVVLGLPSGSIKEIVEDQIADFRNFPPMYILDRSPEMNTQYYSFNLSKDVFKDKRVRQALNYAIDRDRIVEEVLKGEAFGPGKNGITPPSFKGYNVSKIKGYDFDPEKAQQLLADAGYPNGNGFPSLKLKLNSGGAKNVRVASEIQKQWMVNLGITIEVDIIPLAQKLKDELYGKGDIFRTAWIADYPDPVSFSTIFYGKDVPESTEEPAFPNTSRYVNQAYDKLYEDALKIEDKAKRYQKLMEAEQVLMDDAALLVLYYGESYVLIQSDVRNYYNNPMSYKDFSNIYFKMPSKPINSKG